MEKYHIYEEIGKGDFSQVFKGREKKKIEYVAIKRIEKSAMSKIVAEVQIMHKLNHANMLRFHDWYETRNNLWLILEYCTGGDLEAILRQDGHLPENSIRIFGLDIISGLKYLHSNGLIHGDLRPRNFLIDEYGIMKITDFKFTQKIPKEPLGQKPLVERGIPSYMSPELFTPEGVHSFQSDFWALGCVLYELRRGSVPFGDNNLTIEALMDNICTIEPVHNPIVLSTAVTPTPSSSYKSVGVKADTKNNSSAQDSSIVPISAELADIVTWLLEKAPMNRCSWGDLCSHPFWNPTNLAAPSSLPAQPAYDVLVRDLEQTRSRQLENASNAEFQLLNEKSIQATSGSTPLKMPQIQESTPMRPDSLSRSSRRRHDAQDKNTVDEKERYLSSIAEAKESKQDFIADEKTPQVHRVHTKDVQAFATGTSLFDESKLGDKPMSTTENASLPLDATPSSPAKPISKPVGMMQVQQKGLIAKDSPANELGAYGNDISWNISPDSLILHSTDTQVKPIVGNKAIEIMEEIGFPDKTCNFSIFKLEKLAQMPQSDLEAHLTQVYKSLHKSAVAGQSAVANPVVITALTDRVNTLCYLAYISASAEVANIVLNTHFLTLILKLLRSNINYQASAPLRSQSGTQNITNNASTLQQNSRFFCATVLALMLRYATFIQPPAIRSRDDHIVGSLVTVLKDTIKGSDLKMRRRTVAALGEIIFYISAQEEDTGPATNAATDGSDKWTLAPAAIELLGRCLKEDGDEMIKHYAAKTIENVLAQGGISYKKRMVSLEVTLQMLEIAQSSRNEGLQVTCAAAVSHVFHLLLSLHTSGDGDKETSSLAKDSSKNSSNNTRKVAPPIDPFQAPTAVNSAKFIVKVLEKANFPAMLETLRDGQPKLQQAFLNIILMIFVAPFGSAIGTTVINTGVEKDSAVSSIRNSKVDPAEVATVSALLSPCRSFFLRSHAVLLPSLFKLIEQGSLTSIRAKALLLVQILYSQTPVLLTSMPERRIPMLLVRILEPLLNAMESERANTIDVAVVNPSYLMKSAMSLAGFLRASLTRLASDLSNFIEEIAAFSVDSVIEEREEPIFRYDKNGKSPGPGITSPVQQHRSPGKSAMKTKPGMDKLSFSYIQLSQTAEILRALTSVISQPSLGRMILPSSEDFFVLLAKIFHCLPSARARLSSQKSSSSHGMEEALVATEQTCLSCLECISQIEIPQFGVDSASRRETANMRQQRENWTNLLNLVLSLLLPSASQLLSHPDGDVRVVITATLRKLVPNYIKGYFSLFPDSQNGVAEIIGYMNGVLVSVSSLLADHPPIPQYVIRLLLEVFTVSPQFTVEIVHYLKASGSINILIHLLKLYSTSSSNSTGGDNDEGSMVLDPQLLILLRCIFESSVDGSTVLLQGDLAGSLSVAVIATIYANIPYPFQSAQVINHELLHPLIDLLHVVVHHVLRELSSASSAEQASNNRASPQRHINAEQQRKLITPLRAVSPALLMVMGCMENLLSNYPVPSSSTASPAQLEETNQQLLVYAQLLDSSSRCLGILFDLFPDTVASQLLSKQSVTLEQPQGNDLERPSSAFSALNPRSILSSIIRNRKLETRVLLKVLKILFGVCKVASSLGHNVKSIELISSEPILSALQHAARFSLHLLEQQQQQQQQHLGSNKKTNAGNDAQAIGKFAAQLLEMGNSSV